MNKIYSLINQLIEEYEYKFMVQSCKRNAKQNAKPIYALDQLYTGSIVKLQKAKNSSRIIRIPVQDFAIFTSTPYYINFATDLELEPCYNDQIGYYVITSLKPLTESCPQIIERYSLDENSRFSKFDIIDLEEEIINELYPNQKRVCTF